MLPRRGRSRFAQQRRGAQQPCSRRLCPGATGPPQHLQYSELAGAYRVARVCNDFPAHSSHVRNGGSALGIYYEGLQPSASQMPRDALPRLRVGLVSTTPTRRASEGTGSRHSCRFRPAAGATSSRRHPQPVPSRRWRTQRERQAPQPTHPSASPMPRDVLPRLRVGLVSRASVGRASRWYSNPSLTLPHATIRIKPALLCWMSVRALPFWCGDLSIGAPASRRRGRRFPCRLRSSSRQPGASSSARSRNIRPRLRFGFICAI